MTRHLYSTSDGETYDLDKWLSMWPAVLRADILADLETAEAVRPKPDWSDPCKHEAP